MKSVVTSSSINCFDSNLISCIAVVQLFKKYTEMHVPIPVERVQCVVSRGST